MSFGSGKSIGTFLGRWSSLESSLADLRAYLALAGEAGGEGLASEIEQQIVTVDEALDAIELLERMLSGDNDALNAIATIHAGAGDRVQDGRCFSGMYSRFADRNGYAMELVERQEGDEAGIKSATFLLSGDHPYGYLKAETGVHRLRPGSRRSTPTSVATRRSPPCSFRPRSTTTSTSRSTSRT